MADDHTFPECPSIVFLKRKNCCSIIDLIEYNGSRVVIGPLLIFSCNRLHFKLSLLLTRERVNNEFISSRARLFGRKTGSG
jgi:hypothetical protein